MGVIITIIFNTTCCSNFKLLYFECGCQNVINKQIAQRILTDLRK